MLHNCWTTFFNWLILSCSFSPKMRRKNVLFIILNLLFQKKFIATTTNSPTKEIMSTPHATFAATLCHQASTKLEQSKLTLSNWKTLRHNQFSSKKLHCYSFSELVALKDDILSNFSTFLNNWGSCNKQQKFFLCLETVCTANFLFNTVCIIYKEGFFTPTSPFMNSLLCYKAVVR